jgi:hypothetical protein
VILERYNTSVIGTMTTTEAFNAFFEPHIASTNYFVSSALGVFALDSGRTPDIVGEHTIFRSRKLVAKPLSLTYEPCGKE